MMNSDINDGADVNANDVMRIMVSTDNHLGYAEKDPIRGEDSFIAFEEMLSLAVKENVDFILLGGDLFHDAVPSQNTLHKCMALLRRYTFGEKSISLHILSNQATNFHNSINSTVNYEDPNLNISIPVFSIHGNHDDPSGYGRLSSLDLLASTGLVNYFGRWTDLTKVDINPVLIRKGITHLALYGLSHIHDGRLQRLFSNHKVEIASPSEEIADWFHLMVLHQNRADRGPKNYLDIKLLPTFMHLIIWGHEHDCQIEPEHYPLQDFYICQPGSSVPTSLAEGESIPKHVGILEIYKTKFQLKPIKLQTVRPFIFESINLKDLADELTLDEGDASNKVRQMAEERVRAMIERAHDKLTGHEHQPKIPLIRLRICFTDESHMFNAMRFGQMYNEQVANPTDMVHFKKVLKKNIKNETANGPSLNKEELLGAFDKMEIDVCTRVEDFVDNYFDEASDTKTLQAMSSKMLSELCFRLVERRDLNAADNIIKYYKEKAVDHLMEKLPQEDSVREELNQCKTKIKHDDILQMLDERGGKINTMSSGYATSLKTEADEPVTATTTTTSGRGRKRIVEVNKPDLFDNRTAATATTTTSRRGRGTGRSTRSSAAAAAVANTTSTKRTMPQLDVSINKTRGTPRKTTLLDTIRKTTTTSTTGRVRKTTTYVISSDSD